jgi:CDP-6-deoxy-D-xylo-4-hexulose-3-dehydrase
MSGLKQYDYPTAFSYWSAEESRAMDRVLASGRYTMGRECEAFEHEFAAWHGMKHGIMVNSGSSANLVAVAALFSKAGSPLCGNVPIPDRAIVPAIAWSTTYAPLIQHGLDLIVVDCDDTWNAPKRGVFDGKNVRVVVAASILGNPGYLREWRQEADRLGAYMIEDNCESFGAVAPQERHFEIPGRCGTFGDLCTFSFFYSHQISAIEGGMILTNDNELSRLCRMLRAHGWTRDVQDRFTFEEEYSFHLFGFNVRPLELHAAIAREQLKKSVEFKAARAGNAAHFREMTEGLPIVHQRLRGVPSAFGFPFLCRSREERNNLAHALRANGIDCRLPTGGSFTQHRYGERWQNFLTPYADEVHRRGMFLGNAPFDISDKIEKAAAVMREVMVERSVA